ncbi:hypothetical protein V6Z12_D12G216600 [Gossypium hirsutum]
MVLTLEVFARETVGFSAMFLIFVWRIQALRI